MSKTVSFEPSLKDFERLSKYLKNEKGIRELERITPERLRAQYEKQMMAFQFVANHGCDVRKGHPLACAVLWETKDPDIVEIGTIWVHPKYHGKVDGKYREILTDIIRQLFELPVGRWKQLFSITPVSTIAKALLGLQFESITLESTPDIEDWMIKRVGMPKSRVPSSIYRPLRLGLPAGERVLYRSFPGE